MSRSATSFLTVGSGKALAHIHSVCDVGLIHRDVKPVARIAIISVTTHFVIFSLQRGWVALIPERVLCRFALHFDENLRFRTKHPDSELVLVDFGLCCPATTAEKRTIVGTLLYVAPEVFSRKYSTQADLWSIGVILFILLTGQPPWKQNVNVGFVPSKKVLNGEAAQTALTAKAACPQNLTSFKTKWSFHDDM
ncbi:CPK15 [Symbiodinium sp. CCMP2592]|nr:CPK15 [Symbiodinium sp. CCMP2592]